jgi:signal transduction histidine kinase
VAAEAALIALAGGGLDGLRPQILAVLARRCAADVVAVIGLEPPAHEISVLDHIGLKQAPDGLIGAEADLRLVDAEHAVLTPRVGRGAGSIAALLHLSGQRTAVTAGLGQHGVRQVLVVGRARGRFDAAVPAVLAGVARVLASVERRQRVALLAERRLRQQAAVAALGQGALGGGEELAELAEATCTAAAANLPADLVAVLERGPDGLVPLAGLGCTPGELAAELAWSDAPCSMVMRTGEPLVRPGGGDDPMVDLPRGEPPAPASVLIVPIRTGLRVAGVLLAASHRRVAYSEDDVTFARGLANVVALASERARVQAQLRLSVDELRKSAEDRSRLLAHVVQAQEEERQRIADDIHDDSVQVMTAVALRLATLRRRLGEGALDPLLLNLEYDVRQAITRLRHLMFVLRPPALEAHGIAAALHAFLAQVAEDAGFEFALDDRLQREPEPDARTVVYRIAQEAVSNVCKHARAGRIDITLSERDGGVMVEISDDGAGFDTNGPPQAPPGHLGLLVMRERAEQSGGWFTVESRPGAGTTVRYLVGSLLLSGRDRLPAEAGGRRGPALTGSSVS